MVCVCQRVQHCSGTGGLERKGEKPGESSCHSTALFKTFARLVGSIRAHLELPPCARPRLSSTAEPGQG